MGAWGTSLYSDDFACDIRDDYVEKLRRGKTNEEATQEMIDENQSSVENTEDEATFWLALADTQWNYGRLLPDVKEKAMLFVNQDTMAEGWSECGQHTERLKVLHELAEKLNSEQPALKKIRKRRTYQCKWQLGDVFAYRFSSDYSKKEGMFGKYFAFRKVSEDTWWPGHVIPVIQIYDSISDTIPSIDDLTGLAILPAWDDAETMERCARWDAGYKVKLICESEKGIPQDNLTFLGNIPGDDLIQFRGHDYWSGYMLVGWESSKYNNRLEHHVIELYNIWHKANE